MPVQDGTRLYQVKQELKRLGLDHQAGTHDELRERLRAASMLDTSTEPPANVTVQDTKKPPPPVFFYQKLEPGKDVPSPNRVTVMEAQELINTGRLDESCLVWASGMGKEWMPLGEVLGNVPFSELQTRVRRPLSRMVADCNARWKETLPETGTLSFAEDGHHLQWTSSAEESQADDAVTDVVAEPSHPGKEDNVEDLLEQLYAAGDVKAATTQVTRTQTSTAAMAESLCAESSSEEELEPDLRRRAVAADSPQRPGSPPNLADASPQHLAAEAKRLLALKQGRQREVNSRGHTPQSRSRPTAVSSGDSVAVAAAHSKLPPSTPIEDLSGSNAMATRRAQVVPASTLEAGNGSSDEGEDEGEAGRLRAEAPGAFSPAGSSPGPTRGSLSPQPAPVPQPSQQLVPPQQQQPAGEWVSESLPNGLQFTLRPKATDATWRQASGDNCAVQGWGTDDEGADALTSQVAPRSGGKKSKGTTSAKTNKKNKKSAGGDALSIPFSSRLEESQRKAHAGRAAALAQVEQQAKGRGQLDLQKYRQAQLMKNGGQLLADGELMAQLSSLDKRVEDNRKREQLDVHQKLADRAEIKA